jgi:HSP20 family protein
LRELEKEMGRFFGDFTHPLDRFEAGWIPPIDLSETDEALTLQVDLPGLKKEDIEVAVVDNVVTIKGKRDKDYEARADGYHRYERRYGSFQRSFEIPGGFDGNKAAASYEDGVLHVTLPKREETKPKHIEVKVK